jgi:hypothetical protein
MSVARMTEAPSKLTINQENLTGPATRGELNTVSEQVNILVACSESHTQQLNTITRDIQQLKTILKAVADKLGVPAEGLDDGPKVEDLAAKLEDA